MSMQSDNLHKGAEARAKLLGGIRKVSDAVRVTMGTAGSNAIIERWERPFHIITNDGISIAESIVLIDPVENIGRNLLLEAISRSNRQSGDGSSTTTLLTARIIEEGMKEIGSVPPMELKRSLEACLPAILESIDAQTKPITPSEVKQVASISAEDEGIGARLQEIYEKVGKEGIVYLDTAKTFEDSYTLGKGVKIADAGFVSPYMVDTDDAGRMLGAASYTDPKILLTKQKITSAMDLNGVVSKLYNDNIKELVVFCDDFEGTILPDIILTRAKMGFKILIVKMPVIYKDHWFEDIAKLTGATIIDPAAGVALKDTLVEHLGSCGNIIVDKTDTYLDGTRDITAHVEKLSKGSDDDQIRAARLNVHTARYFVGAHSDSALSYRRLKVEDARNSAYAALQHGIVPGGGIALVNAAKDLRKTISIKVDIASKVGHGSGIGVRILSNALTAPFKQICENAGVQTKGAETDEEMERPGVDLQMLEGDKGFNSKTGQVVSMFEAGIVDSADVVKTAITNAISVASTVLTAETILTMPKPENVQMPAPQL